jgi:hypothetical protein
MLGELSLHLGCPHYSVVFTDVVVLESDRATVLKVLLSRYWCRTNTVSTDIKICAESTLEVIRFVVHAAAVRDTLAVGILIDHSGVATIARATGLAVDDRLSGEVKGSREVKSVQNVEPIGKRTRSGLCPARATVSRDVLIFAPGKPVAAIKISPVNCQR